MGAYEEFIERKTQLDNDGGFAPIVMPEFLFDFQQSLVEWSLRKGRSALFEDCGLGKGFPAGTPVLTPSGWQPIGTLEVGDLVIGRDGKAHGVTAVHQRGIQPTFKVSFSDGVAIVCDDDHLWSVRSMNDTARGKPWRVLSTAQLRATALRYGADGKSRTWRIPLVEPVEFPAHSHPLHPYLLGVLLGDGSFDSSTPRWTKNDAEIAKRISELLPPSAAVVCHDGDRTTSWSIVNEPRNTGVTNPVHAAIVELGLQGKDSASKFVPEQYLFSSAHDRIALLQGLMDTDGYCGDPTPEFSSASRALAEAVVFLAQSLGGTGHLSLKEEPTFQYEGETRIGQPSWRVTVCLPPGIAPFSLPRKAEKYRPTSRGLGRWIDSIEPCEMQATICISIDSSDSLYVADHFIVTHNTPQLLVWAENVLRHTNKPILILNPLAVSSQTVREGEKFGIEVKRPGAAVENSIYVTNYERLHHLDCNNYAGVVCDESSILKSFDGVTRAAVTDFMRKVPYRLLCTATAAPNDFIELGTSSEALGYLGHMDMLNRFFKNDRNNSSTGRAWGAQGGGAPMWRFRGHAEQSFWRWVCSWARSLRKPSDLGFSDERFALPPLIEQEHTVKARAAREGFLFSLPAVGLAEEREERRRTLTERCEMVATLVATNINEPSLVWCHLNAEGDMLERLIPGSVQVCGDDPLEFKEDAIEWFQGKKCVCQLSTKWSKLASWEQGSRPDTGKGITRNIESSDSQPRLPIPQITEMRNEFTLPNTIEPIEVNIEEHANSKMPSTIEGAPGMLPIPITESESKRTCARKTKNKSAIINSRAVTESALNDTINCSPNRAVDAPSVESLPPTSEIIAPENKGACPSTTATLPSECEEYSARLAISDSENSEITRNVSNERPCTCGYLSGKRVLISKPTIFGYGVNLQCCAHMTVFPSHSYEQYYQSVRRCWRFGQTRTVVVDIVMSDGEQRVLINFRRKSAQAERMFIEMTAHMLNALGIKRGREFTKTEEVPSWLLPSN